MAVVTGQGINRVIGRDPVWLVFDVDFTVDTGDATVTLRELPTDSVIIDGWMYPETLGDSGTSDTIHMLVEMGYWFAGTTTGGGNARGSKVLDRGAIDHWTVVEGSNSLICEYASVGTAPSVTPIVRVGVLVYRPNF